MSQLHLTAAVEEWHLKKPFRISGHVFKTCPTLLVTATRGDVRGRGEAAGVYFLGEDVAGMCAQVRAAAEAVAEVGTREGLRTIMAPGGARNAIDCALWDLEAQEAGCAVWELGGLPPPRRLPTIFTIGAGDPDVMAVEARALARAGMLKLKLTGDADTDIERVVSVRRARPDVWLAVDANQGFTPTSIEPLLPALWDCDVRLLEQPLPRGEEAAMRTVDWGLPTVADESCCDLADLDRVAGCFSMVNIKLDKSGGLTEALMMARHARTLGLGLMVGNMVGTSLAMAPAFVLGQQCEVVDLDGVVFLTADRAPTVAYSDGMIECTDQVWGGKRRVVG